MGSNQNIATAISTDQLRCVKVAGQSDIDVRSENPSRKLVVIKYLKIRNQK
jgi:hypothetical protein